MKNKKNNFILVGLMLSFLVSCSAKLPTDPLLIPPRFNELPTQDEIKGLDQKNPVKDSENNEDVQELKDLLLD